MDMKLSPQRAGVDCCHQVERQPSRWSGLHFSSAPPPCCTCHPPPYCTWPSPPCCTWPSPPPPPSPPCPTPFPLPCNLAEEVLRLVSAPEQIHVQKRCDYENGNQTKLSKKEVSVLFARSFNRNFLFNCLSDGAIMHISYILQTNGTIIWRNGFSFYRKLSSLSYSRLKFDRDKNELF